MCHPVLLSKECFPPASSRKHLHCYGSCDKRGTPLARKNHHRLPRLGQTTIQGLRCNLEQVRMELLQEGMDLQCDVAYSK